MPPLPTLLDPVNLDHKTLLEGVQGNILKGHGRPYTANVFIRCYQPTAEPDPDWLNSRRGAAKTWLNSLVHPERGVVRSAYAQWQSNILWRDQGVDAGLFAAINISATGYRYLFGDGAQDRFGEGAFWDGMKLRQSVLKDSLSDEWETGLQANNHFMLLLAHSDLNALKVARAAILQMVQSFAEVTTVECGNVLWNKAGQVIEHFGYVDGISDPVFFEADWSTYKANNDLPADADDVADPRLKFDPRRGSELVLAPDPFVDGNDNARGSYLVFRKLEQNVRVFKQAEQQLAQNLGLPDADRKRAGASLIGRFEDGTPVMLSEQNGLINSHVLNNFAYGFANDSRCPYNAHIRKVNSRESNRQKHAIVRRGMPYGIRTDDPNDDDLATKPETRVGLLFMAYQRDIGKQFEVIQRDWVNNNHFPNGVSSGTDPIIGQGNVVAGNVTAVWGDWDSRRQIALASFVTMKGGEYFFAPSMAFLRGL